MVRADARAPRTTADGLALLAIKIYTSIKDAETAWRAAEAHGIGYGFQSFVWLSTWQETIGTVEGVKPYIAHVVDESGAPVMLLALGIRRYFGCSVLGFLGGQLADYHSPILRADFARSLDDTTFRRLWAEIVQQLPPVPSRPQSRARCRLFFPSSSVTWAPV